MIQMELPTAIGLVIAITFSSTIINCTIYDTLVTYGKTSLNVNGITIVDFIWNWYNSIIQREISIMIILVITDAPSLEIVVIMSIMTLKITDGTLVIDKNSSVSLNKFYYFHRMVTIISIRYIRYIVTWKL